MPVTLAEARQVLGSGVMPVTCAEARQVLDCGVVSVTSAKSKLVLGWELKNEFLKHIEDNFRLNKDLNYLEHLETSPGYVYILLFVQEFL